MVYKMFHFKVVFLHKKKIANWGKHFIYMYQPSALSYSTIIVNIFTKMYLYVYYYVMWK